MGDIADDHYAEIRWNAEAGGTFGIMAEKAMNRADKLGVMAQKRDSCKFCGASGLRWVRQAGKWQLSNHAGETHRCINKSIE